MRRPNIPSPFLLAFVALPTLLSCLLGAAAVAIAGTETGLEVAAEAAKKPYVTTHQDVNTECKTCPRSLCPNVELRQNETGWFNVTCWTRGTRIMGDNLWLKTESDCYVTQYDIREYEGNWDEDLAYCGKESEEQHLTLEDATLRYKTECRICPTTSLCDVIAYLPEETDLTLTCWTDQGTPYMNDPYWWKTTNNCYVAEVGLYDKPDRADLDFCGPIPLLEKALHWNENGTSDVNRKRDPEPEPEPQPEPAESGAKYLVEVKVGEEYSYCRESPDPKSKVIEAYPFNATVWMQCVTEKENVWWAQSTDFCYCLNLDFWDEPLDNYRMPLCEYFENPGSGGEVIED